MELNCKSGKVTKLLAELDSKKDIGQIECICKGKVRSTERGLFIRHIAVRIKPR